MITRMNLQIKETEETFLDQTTLPTISTINRFYFSKLRQTLDEWGNFASIFGMEVMSKGCMGYPVCEMINDG